MSLSNALRIARRELRGGLAGFRIFLVCIALSVAAIAAVGTVRDSIDLGLQREGAAILGGDAQIELTYRFATAQERAWMNSVALESSEIVDFRSMAVVGADRALTQVKAVDDAYPLYGAVRLDASLTLSNALDGENGLPGAVMDFALADRLGLVRGSRFSLGKQEFVLTAVLLREPDAVSGGFNLGPRTIVRTSALQESGLLQSGTLFETAYRLRFDQGTDLAQMEAEAKNVLPAAGLRWRDRRNGAPGVSEFVDRLSAFLVLVGLAGLAVGGVGVSAAVRSYLGEKTSAIAILKTLGAETGTIFLAYGLQIAVMAALGITIGLFLGALIPLVLAPLIVEQLPIPAVFAVHPAALAEAALYGTLAAAIFTLWPLAQTEQVRAAALFRNAAGGGKTWPRWPYIVATGVLLGLLVAAASTLSGLEWLTLWSTAGLFIAFLILLAVAYVTRRLAARAARARLMRGRSVLRLALGSAGGPGSEAGAVVLSLGLGLTVLAAVGQIDANLRGAIARDLPKVAPSYFVVDIQGDQLAAFMRLASDDPLVSRVQTAPMLRGVVSRINGRPAAEVAGEHWVLHGDRGITYSATPPEGTQITEGKWWPEDYSGPPQISFAAEEAAEIGLRLGDTLTVNVLGRDITAEITSFRNVDFSSAGIGFIMSMNPSALQNAPHTNIATIYADEAAEGRLLREIGTAFPNVTLIGVRDAIASVGRVLKGVASAATYGALATLVTGLIVLIGAAAAGERARTYEAAVLKTLGASRRSILMNFALRSAFFGLAAGAVAIAAGGIAGWAVTRFVMETDFQFELASAVAVVSGGVLTTVLAGLAFAWRPLAARPARVLRASE